MSEGVTHKGNQQLQLQDRIPGKHVVKEGREQVRRVRTHQSITEPRLETKQS